jgi:hypothetical protein
MEKKEEIKEIRQVYVNKVSKQKLITIPKKSKINGGDYVEVKKL